MPDPQEKKVELNILIGGDLKPGKPYGPFVTIVAIEDGRTESYPWSNLICSSLAFGLWAFPYGAMLGPVPFVAEGTLAARRELRWPVFKAIWQIRALRSGALFSSYSALTPLAFAAAERVGIISENSGALPRWGIPAAFCILASTSRWGPQGNAFPRALSSVLVFGSMMGLRAVGRLKDEAEIEKRREAGT